MFQLGEAYFLIKTIFIMRNLTDFCKTVEINWCGSAPVC